MAKHWKELDNLEAYDYYNAVRDDIVDWCMDTDVDFDSFSSREELAERLFTIFTEEDDTPTGLMQGTYTSSYDEAERYITYNWDLAYNVAQEYGIDEPLANPSELDACIRDYVLGEAIELALIILENKGVINF